MWLAATNHCLLAGVLDWHGCEMASCAADHDLDHDHSDGCRTNCDALEKPLVVKDARTELAVVPPAAVWLTLLALPPRLEPVAIFPLPPPEERRQEWLHTWQFQTHAAPWPGAPAAV